MAPTLGRPPVSGKTTSRSQSAGSLLQAGATNTRRSLLAAARGAHSRRLPALLVPVRGTQPFRRHSAEDLRNISANVSVAESSAGDFAPCADQRRSLGPCSFDIGSLNLPGAPDSAGTYEFHEAVLLSKSLGDDLRCTPQRRSCSAESAKFSGQYIAQQEKIEGDIATAGSSQGSAESAAATSATPGLAEDPSDRSMASSSQNTQLRACVGDDASASRATFDAVAFDEVVREMIPGDPVHGDLGYESSIDPDRRSSQSDPESLAELRAGLPGDQGDDDFASDDSFSIGEFSDEGELRRPRKVLSPTALRRMSDDNVAASRSSGTLRRMSDDSVGGLRISNMQLAAFTPMKPLSELRSSSKQFGDALDVEAPRPPSSIHRASDSLLDLSDAGVSAAGAQTGDVVGDGLEASDEHQARVAEMTPMPSGSCAGFMTATRSSGSACEPQQRRRFAEDFLIPPRVSGSDGDNPLANSARCLRTEVHRHVEERAESACKEVDELLEEAVRQLPEQARALPARKALAMISGQVCSDLPICNNAQDCNRQVEHGISSDAAFDGTRHENPVGDCVDRLRKEVRAHVRSWEEKACREVDQRVFEAVQQLPPAVRELPARLALRLLADGSAGSLSVQDARRFLSEASRMQRAVAKHSVDRLSGDKRAKRAALMKRAKEAKRNLKKSERLNDELMLTLRNLDSMSLDERRVLQRRYEFCAEQLLNRSGCHFTLAETQPSPISVGASK